MRYALLALDLDGTTLTARGGVSPRTRAAIAAARARGVEVVLVTGRHHVAVLPYHADLHLTTPAICCNGTYVYDFAAGRVDIGDPLSRDTARRALALCRRHDVHTLVYTGEAMTYEVENAHMRVFRAWAESCPAAVRPRIDRVDDFGRLIDSADTLWKLVVSDADPAKLAAWSSEAAAAGDLSIEFSWRDRLDVVAAGNTKGRRLFDWAAARGVARQAIIAIGDNHNDLSMIADAGCGVAMGNAEAAVKAVARLVVADNDSDGVAEAIERLILA